MQTTVVSLTTHNLQKNRTHLVNLPLVFVSQNIGDTRGERFPLRQLVTPPGYVREVRANVCKTKENQNIHFTSQRSPDCIDCCIVFTAKFNEHVM